MLRSLPGIHLRVPRVGFRFGSDVHDDLSGPSGAANLNSVYLLINSGLSPANGCYLFYQPGTQMLYLTNDAGNNVAGGIAPGTSKQVNGQCTLGGHGSSASITGNTLALTAMIAFSQAFSGPKTLFMLAEDNQGKIAGGKPWEPGSFRERTGRRPIRPDVGVKQKQSKKEPINRYALPHPG